MEDTAIIPFFETCIIMYCIVTFSLVPFEGTVDAFVLTVYADSITWPFMQSGLLQLMCARSHQKCSVADLFWTLS